MTNFYLTFIKGTSWLYTKIYENSIFFLDLWSVIHIITGILIMLSLIAFKIKYKTLNLLAILLLWEILEISFLKIAFNIFQPETFKDQATDVIIGLLSGVLFMYFLNFLFKYQKIPLINIGSVSALITALLISFTWVGTYHYHYSIIEFNTPGINFWALILWITGYLSILRYYHFLENKIQNIILRILGLWVTYFGVLLIIEFFGRHIFQIKENSSPNLTPLIFNLIYGNAILHIVYIFAPIIALVVFFPIRILVIKAQNSN